MRDNDWTDPRWRAAAHAWVTARLGEVGTPVTGEIEEFRVRPWSVTHRVPTGAGVRWFKANITGCRYEAGLAEALAGIAPGATLAPLAVDTDRGWLLTADAGPTLRSTITADGRTTTWIAMLQAYSVLQRATVAHVDRLCALGVPDQRPSLLPGLLAGLLDDPSVTADLDPRVPALTGDFARWCAELAADGVPAAVQHDDLHDDNVFADLRFFDWGDASVGHPFGTLLVTLNTMHDALDAADRPATLARLRDAYLEPWTDLADLSALRRSATLACRVTRVSRAMSWQRGLADAVVPVDERFRNAPAAWLGELLEPTTI
ncbi:phosphotransferase [Actinoplanes sichuanensis]|uniref:Phosphotransferase n=1 Tax=Actinoplanes sichuanensis TaxID=512349 RepID=A0ABW4AU98_9ACTN|nr:phosphotransferase [Actinoplanes sichuanensis]BEL04777.1 phosphotransferase [Actinoplanes sichuanensis]